VSGSPALTRIVEIHFLHFAVLMFVVSTLVLVGVSLATSREPREKLTGLTFATLKEPYTARAGTPATVATQLAASIVVAALVIGLWWYFA
jgi:SSS family solute:Na+ symporter